MSDIKKSILQIATLEEIARKDTPIHRLQPSVKLIITIIYLVAIISFRPYQISGMLSYIFYPVILMTVGEIPFRPLFQRLFIAIPFTLFTGISNLMFNQDIAFYVGNIGITEGAISFFSILLKTVLTVMAVLILISTTSMNDLVYAMIQYKIPSMLVIQIMMTYRYIGVLLEEVSVMYNAYRLRAPMEKGIRIKHMGPFLGQLIIRSFDRAERIYHAMKCRGFHGDVPYSKGNKITKEGIFTIILVGSLLITLRLVNVSEVIGKLLI